MVIWPEPIPINGVFPNCHRFCFCFRGPHAYVSPTWYDSPGVPTWNSVSVEVEGRVELISDQQQARVLEKRLAQFDPELQLNLLAGLPEVRKNKMFEMICGFRIDIEQIQAKFKLSQNRPQQDRQSIIQHYRELGGDLREQLARFMIQR